MRKAVLTALAAAAFAAPAPVLAQDADLPPLELAEDDEAALTEKFADPEFQRQTALMVRTMTEVLLDMPLAPMMDALGEAGANLTGEKPPKVDPDATLRSLAPGASRVPEQIERNLPRAMQTMGSMAEAFEAMKPALRDMAERMRETLPEPR